MTQALQQLAGSALRQILLRFTKSPTSGALTGAITTAILQSSSATTVAAVGFVGAGIITFSESLGIIFGANIGTTITGWLVVLVGVKLQLGTILLPVIFIGTLLRLFAKGKYANIGMTIAGFGLVFVGIEYMQLGMADLKEFVTPSKFPDDTWIGRLQLVFFGIAITLVTQSSSAGVATAITALYAGAINFHQAAALVIGMDVGTTITALMMTIGGSVGVKRTGLSHVIYNIFTAIGALLLLTPFTFLYEYMFPSQLAHNAEIALVAFHTLFNGLGVIVVLPFTRQFARMMSRLVGYGVRGYTDNLEKSFINAPDVAIASVKSALRPQLLVLLEYVKHILKSYDTHQTIDFTQLEVALDQTHEYVDLIHLPTHEQHNWQNLVSLIHALDHMQRLHQRCRDHDVRALHHQSQQVLVSAIDELVYTVDMVIDAVQLNHFDRAQKEMSHCHDHWQSELEQFRHLIMNQTAEGHLDVPLATQALDCARALQRMLYNLQQAIYYFTAIKDTLERSHRNDKTATTAETM